MRGLAANVGRLFTHLAFLFARVVALHVTLALLVWQVAVQKDLFRVDLNGIVELLVVRLWAGGVHHAEDVVILL
jgi:hypothetical protein